MIAAMPKQNEVSIKLGAPKFIMPLFAKAAMTPNVNPAPTMKPMIMTAIRLAVMCDCSLRLIGADCSLSCGSRQVKNSWLSEEGEAEEYNVEGDL